MSLSTDALIAFVLAAEQGSFSAAARSLGKRQSTISETIANLEIDLGVTLFERGGRQPQLSAAGQRLLPFARQSLASQDSLLQQAQLLAAGQETRLAIVLSDTFHTGDFEAVLGRFAERFPLVELECLVGEQDDVLALVQGGRANLGLMMARADYAADLAHQALARQAETSLYVAAGHPLAQLASVGEAELLRWRELRLRTYQDTPQPDSGGQCWSAPSYLLLMEMALHGFGWAELPHWLVERYGSGLQRLPVAGWPRRQRIDAVWSRRQPPGPAAAWMLQVLLGAEF
ncbi:LysR family transcriptional regulator [Vogesella sp. LIG4]|uniref:LysR family transcriptional regulator n=1 Tax=Vogesella sp. LIG4 TaxID=1192162 RepID=UPI00081F8E02|nr:LysR family transcriptional regulator [Vogesella sp. LIG4]SCK06927.1 DNA-binding transcriptional regulator, LysR family [Vogesella sp. LIG4]